MLVVLAAPDLRVCAQGGDLDVVGGDDLIAAPAPLIEARTLGAVEDVHRAHLGKILLDQRIGQQFGLDHGQVIAGLIDGVGDEQDVRFESVAQTPQHVGLADDRTLGMTARRGHGQTESALPGRLLEQFEQVHVHLRGFEAEVRREVRQAECAEGALAELTPKSADGQVRGTARIRLRRIHVRRP